ncbi:MAG: 4Fe-4S dicluster domain-containing protein [Bacteroidales bacterium]|jgi:quinone-modifying oxidoreductase subunit QmoC|nr:4Fe-4S dicluster domain-containing protein [Bacteroidales bacterium]
MRTRVDAKFKRELNLFGSEDWSHCFHCGNCTAACPLSENAAMFPRKSLRAIQLGLKDQIISNPEPWLCYYCGDCSEKCPQGANPAELMMTLRRYLTSVYDWTGLSRLFYTKHWFEIVALVVLGLIVGLGLSIFNPNGIVYPLNADGGVKINEMFPIPMIHLGDMIMAAFVSFFLISNILHMWYRIILKPKVSVPFYSYFTELISLGYQFITQSKFSKCDTNGRKYWASHWLLMSGYTIMFVLVVGFLSFFQTEIIYSWYEPQRLLGYYATFGLLFGLTYVSVGRIKKSTEKAKFSLLSDWLFIILLFLTTLSGILVHFFRIYGLVELTYYMYVIHLAILVPMICVEVPFSKWSHLAYRPIAIYLLNLKKKAENRSLEANPQLAVN